MRQAFISGRLGADPELRQAGQTPVLNLRVATSEREKVDGEWQDVTTWFGVSLFGKRAESLSRFLRKGAFVSVVGKLRVRTYQTRDGETRTALEIDSSDIDPGPKQEQRSAGTHRDYEPGEHPATAPAQQGGFEDDIPF